VGIGKGTPDLDFMLEDSGVPIVFRDAGGEVHEGFGIVNEADVDGGSAEGGSLSVHEIEVELRGSSFPGLAAEATLTVDGTDYRVTQVRQIDDGEPLRAWCARKE
jgi:hypothetical protein